MADSMYSSVLDRDLICQPNPMTMGGFRNPFSFGMGMYNNPYNPYMTTNFLGGMTMAPALTTDVYGSAQRARYKNWGAFKTVTFGLLAAGATLFAGAKVSKLFRTICKKFGSTK